MSSGDEYAAAVIKKTVWGQVASTPDGSWVTEWHFKMDTSHVSSTDLEIKTDPDEGFTAVLHVSEPGSATLRVQTSRQAMSPEYYPMTFASFRIVNDEIGTIETIENLPRDWYAPFRSRGQ
jgi:hypothetical protein